MQEPLKRGTLAWAEVSRERKREIIEAIAAGTATQGPVYAELDINDRCNVACYFCNQQDTRTLSQVPLTRAVELIDELVATGLRSVRLSGGGDPLFHKEIVGILGHLARRNVVVDNVTTNGISLTGEVAELLVENRAREVILSLNAVDAEDYHRMMRVKPAFFEKVLDNARHLIELRGDATFPAIVIQFLLDQDNCERMVEMYELARPLGPDRIAINMVLEIPRERIEAGRLLAPEDRERARPLVEELLRRDRDAKLLQMDFPILEWNRMLVEAQAAAEYEPVSLFPTAPSFKDANGGCFFAWYATTITGNGNIHPCCLLISSDRPLGNVSDSTFTEHWNGPKYQTMRSEMRQILLEAGEAEWDPERFEIVQQPCVEPHICWLKNMYFRADEDFYRELGTALEAARAEERSRARTTARKLKKQVQSLVDHHPGLSGPWDRVRNGTRPLRGWLARRTGLPVTEDP